MTDDGRNYDNSQVADNDRKGNWMQLYTGKRFWPEDFREEDVDILDIAHALAHQCRYAGHCHEHYSVAEHSVHLSHLVEPELALVALMQDSTETYVIDIPRPLKPYLPEYSPLEDRIWSVIANRFDLPQVIPDAVKDLDTRILLAEREQIMTDTPFDWNISGEVPDVDIQCWDPHFANLMFLERFIQLTA